MIKKLVKPLVFTLIICAILVGAYYWLMVPHRQNEKDEVQIKPVEMAVASIQNLPLTTQSMGNIIAPERVELKVQEAGIVTALNFKGGEHVKKKQLLVHLQDIEELEAMEEGQSQFQQDKAHFERIKKLFKYKTVSESDFDEAKSQYLKSLAKLKFLKQKIENTKIFAPFSGTISITDLTLGSYVKAGENVATLVNLNNLQVSYELPEKYYAKVKLGQTVSLKVDAYPDQLFTSKVIYIAPVVDEETHRFAVRTKVDNPPKTLLPGMLVEATQILQKDRRILVIPVTALISEAKGYSVYKIGESNKLLKVNVKVSQRYGNMIGIESGLSQGDKVVSIGVSKVNEGNIVKIIETSK